MRLDRVKNQMRHRKVVVRICFDHCVDDFLHLPLFTVYTTVLIFVIDIFMRYSSSCRYNERQLIDVTVVRRVRPRAERTCVRVDFCRLIPGTYVSGT